MLIVPALLDDDLHRSLVALVSVTAGTETFPWQPLNRPRGLSSARSISHIISSAENTGSLSTLSIPTSHCWWHLETNINIFNHQLRLHRHRRRLRSTDRGGIKGRLQPAAVTHIKAQRTGMYSENKNNCVQQIHVESGDTLHHSRMLIAGRYWRCVCARLLISLEGPEIIQLILQPPPSQSVSAFMYIFVSVPVAEALYIFNYRAACVVKLHAGTPGTYLKRLTCWRRCFILTWLSELREFLHLSPLTSLF